MYSRRLITIPALIVIALVAYALAPLLIVAAILLSPIPKLRSLPHAVLFALGFIYFEIAGDLGLLWAIRHRGDQRRFLLASRQVQWWWAQGLLNLGIRIYRLKVSVTGQDAIPGNSAILISRHTSLGDTVLPLVYFAAARDENLRYILKKELTIFPSIDIGGHRMPNLFVDRSGLDTQRELQAVTSLITSADNESVLVYVEGTRNTSARRANLANSRPEIGDQLRRWPNLLPPRLGGVSTMLDVNSGKDVVFLCHVGFEGSASVADLINGSWCKQHVQLHFWRIAHPDIPNNHQQFIFEQWDIMQATVQKLSADVAPENSA